MTKAVRDKQFMINAYVNALKLKPLGVSLMLQVINNTKRVQSFVERRSNFVNAEGL